jgi:hypothetical protein
MCVWGVGGVGGCGGTYICGCGCGFQWVCFCVRMDTYNIYVYVCVCQAMLNSPKNWSHIKHLNSWRNINCTESCPPSLMGCLSHVIITPFLKASLKSCIFYSEVLLLKYLQLWQVAVLALATLGNAMQTRVASGNPCWNGRSLHLTSLY